jgi:hypothetical protein
MAKFIKFVNEELNHNGFLYSKEGGLIEDVIPMTDGQCEPGGYYLIFA